MLNKEDIQGFDILAWQNADPDSPSLSHDYLVLK